MVFEDWEGRFSTFVTLQAYGVSKELGRLPRPEWPDFDLVWVGIAVTDARKSEIIPGSDKDRAKDRATWAEGLESFISFKSVKDNYILNKSNAHKSCLSHSIKNFRALTYPSLQSVKRSMRSSAAIEYIQARLYPNYDIKILMTRINHFRRDGTLRYASFTMSLACSRCSRSSWRNVGDCGGLVSGNSLRMPWLRNHKHSFRVLERICHIYQ